MRMGGMSTGGIKNLINKKKEDYWVIENNQMPFPLWILLTSMGLTSSETLINMKNFDQWGCDSRSRSHCY
jgi:hypothetical protein